MDFFTTTVTPQSIALADKTLQSGFLSEGKIVREFEQALEEYLGWRNVVCVNSGTSALHLALAMLGISKGDEVIVPAQTFIATALAVTYTGAVPVFADIDPATGNLSVESVKSKITDKTRVLLPVHWAGYVCDLEELWHIARDRFLVVIDDAAHALGATYKGKPIGNCFYTAMTAFSFQSIKHVTTGDGGAICTWSKPVARDLRKLRWFGIDRESDLPDELGERQYLLEEIGFKHHLNDLAASVGMGNLVGFKDRLARRREIAATYFKELANIAGLKLMSYKDDRESSYWLFPLRVERRLDFVRKLKSAGIPTSVVHQRIDKHPIFGSGIREDLVGQATFEAEQIHIPVHDGLGEEDVWHVIETIRSGW